MIDPISAVGIGLIVGGLSGALSAYLGWNRSGEPFDSRKFVDGLATGVISGIGLVFVNLQAFKEATDPFTILALYGTIAAGALGADFVREHVSSIVVKPKEPTTTTPPVNPKPA